MKAVVAVEAPGLANSSVTMKNWTFSLDLATLRASWRSLSGVSCRWDSEEAEATGGLTRAGSISSRGGKGLAARSL